MNLDDLIQVVVALRWHLLFLAVVTVAVAVVVSTVERRNR